MPGSQLIYLGKSGPFGLFAGGVSPADGEPGKFKLDDPKLCAEVNATTQVPFFFDDSGVIWFKLTYTKNIPDAFPFVLPRDSDNSGFGFEHAQYFEHTTEETMREFQLWNGGSHMLFERKSGHLAAAVLSTYGLVPHDDEGWMMVQFRPVRPTAEEGFFPIDEFAPISPDAFGPDCYNGGKWTPLDLKDPTIRIASLILNQDGEDASLYMGELTGEHIGTAHGIEKLLIPKCRGPKSSELLTMFNTYMDGQKPKEEAAPPARRRPAGLPDESPREKIAQKKGKKKAGNVKKSGKKSGT